MQSNCQRITIMCSLDRNLKDFIAWLLYRMEATVSCKHYYIKYIVQTVDVTK